jgi:hypothetical protein
MFVDYEVRPFSRPFEYLTRVTHGFSKPNSRISIESILENFPQPFDEFVIG